MSVYYTKVNQQLPYILKLFKEAFTLTINPTVAMIATTISTAPIQSQKGNTGLSTEGNMRNTQLGG